MLRIVLSWKYLISIMKCWFKKRNLIIATSGSFRHILLFTRVWAPVITCRITIITFFSRLYSIVTTSCSCRTRTIALTSIGIDTRIDTNYPPIFSCPAGQSESSQTLQNFAPEECTFIDTRSVDHFLSRRTLRGLHEPEIGFRIWGGVHISTRTVYFLLPRRTYIRIVVHTITIASFTWLLAHSGSSLPKNTGREVPISQKYWNKANY